MNPIQFYMSVDVTLSEKLLEVMYCLIGLISMYVAFKNLKDKENKNSVGSFVFWFDLGVMFVLGKWLPALVDGILLIVLVLPPILKKVSPGNEPEPTLEEMEQNNKKIGAKGMYWFIRITCSFLHKDFTTSWNECRCFCGHDYFAYLFKIKYTKYLLKRLS